MPKYPAQIDTSQSLPTAVDNFTPVQGSVFNRLRDAVLAIETELGVKPSGIYSNVAGRLNNLEGIVGNLKIIELEEDLGGTLESPLVVGLQGRPVSTIAPGVGQVLVWNGIAWVPGAGGTGGAGGTLFVDQLIPPFAINLQPNNLLVEVGQTVTNPAFTVDYHFFPSLAVTPQILFLVDSENGISQNVESTPNAFNSMFSFTKNAFDAIVTFTLTATVDPITKIQTATITWAQKLYWGLGPAGQSGASFITSLTGQALTTTKDFAFAVNAGATDKVYFACRSAYGPVVFTVHDVEGGFTKTGTFLVTNSHGFAENYDLYESDNTNLGNIIVITGEGDDEFIGGGGPVGPPGPPGQPGTISAVIFDGGTTSQNARTNRAAHQSPIDNTKNGIINLGSDTTNITTGVTADFGTVLGGDQNIVTNPYGVVCGGLANSANFNSFVGGGSTNIVSSGFGSITGGTNNQVSSGAGHIGGGESNICEGSHSIIGGGFTNVAGNDFSTIAGGNTNNAFGQNSFIGGGSGNTIAISGNGATIAGGLNNFIANVGWATISGGTANIINGIFSFIGGGTNNNIALDAHSATTDKSVICGGETNFSDATWSFIGGGNNNHQGSMYGVIAGGQNNFIGSAGISFGTHSHNTIGGGFGNTIDIRLDGVTIPGGYQAHGYKSGQFVYAAGAFSVAGDAQISTYLVKGESDNGASINLAGLFGGDLPILSGFAYTVRATCTANRIDAQGCATFIHTLLVHSSGGVTTIDSTNTTLSIPNGQTWTIAYTASLGSVIATFTGTAGQNVRAMVKYEVSEVGGGP
jgi:hypothetical protein